MQNDFTVNFDAPTFAKMYDEHLKDIDVSVLVNNVGMAEAKGLPLSENTAEDVHKMMSCNMYANVLLTREVIQGFKQRFEKHGKRSCITFTSAMAALAPVPGVAVYSASKIFTDFLTWGLIYELTKYNVDVSAWRAAGVSTNIIDNEEPGIMVSTADNYVKRAFAKCTSGVHSAYLPHEIIHLVWTNLNDILPISFC